MASVDFAILCSSALEHGGLVSILGGGLDRISGPQLPMQLVVTLATRIIWEDGELGRPQVLRLLVEHGDDGEQLARIEGSAVPNRRPDAPRDLPVGSVLIQPLPLDIRRAGRYRVVVAINGEPLAVLPLIAETTLPQL